MRTLMTLILTVVATVAVLMASPAVACADAGADRPDTIVAVDRDVPAAAQPGTLLESRDYAAREAASPEVQEFAGGDVVIGVSLLAIAVIVLIVILLSD